MKDVGLADEARHDGAQGPLADVLRWSLLPRLAAAAEAMWSPKAKREYRGFLSRLQPHYRLYERLGLPYARRMENSLPIWKRIAELRTFFRRDTHAELAGNQRK